MIDIVQTMRLRARTGQTKNGVLLVTGDELQQLMDAFPPEQRWVTPHGTVIFEDPLWGLEFQPHGEDE